MIDSQITIVNKKINNKSCAHLEKKMNKILPLWMILLFKNISQIIQYQ